MRASAICFAIGAALMLVFEHTVTRVAGMALIAAAVALGVTAIASPDYIAQDDPPNVPEPPA